MTQPNEVLVIIVNYRSGQFTLRALESLAAERQSHPELGLRAVIVENASGDEALLEREIGACFAEWATLLVSPTNDGFGAGNNRGIRWALENGSRARFFHFLNPDTEIRPGAVSELVGFLEASPSAGIAGSRLQNHDGSDWSFAFRFPSPLGELHATCELALLEKMLDRHAVSRRMSDEPAQVDWVSGASFMMRSEVLKQIGGFDEEYFLYFEEVDLCLRAGAVGWKVWYVPASRVMHVSGQSTGMADGSKAPSRIPHYWFQSRRRYFAKNHGYRYAALADIAFLLGQGIAGAKRIVRRKALTPHLFRDFLRGSVLWPHNLKPVAPLRSSLRTSAAGGART